MVIHASYVAPSILRLHLSWHLIAEGKERDSGEDTLAFELPQSRSDPYCFCSLPIDDKKPLVCPSIKETRTGSLAVGWEEVWVKVSNLHHTGTMAGANSPDHCE